MRYLKLETISIMVFLLAVSLYGQEVVVPLAPSDGTPATHVNTRILADTAAAGGFKANRVYELQRDGVYLHNAVVTVPNGQTLRMRAAAGSGKKPIIYLWETGTGGTPTRPPGNFVVLNGGHLEIKDIGIAGFYEPESDRVDGVQGGLINTAAVGSSIVLDGVVFSNINGQHVRTGFNTTKVKITNSIFANMGALTTSNLGAGKGIDLREVACDSFIVVNNTFVNFQDRAIRHYNFANPQAGTGEIKYGLIDHNTFINGMGYHGLLSLGNVGPKIIITNNLFVDAFALGEDSTDATRAAEWANTGEIYPNGRNRITWIFTTPNTTTQWAVRSNYYAISAAGSAFLNDFRYPPGSPLSYHINSRLGADSVNAFTRVDLALGRTPRLMTNMMRWYESATGGNRTKNTPSPFFNRLTDDYDRRRIEFYRDSLDATYSIASAAYTGAQKGFPVGDLNWFPAKKADWLRTGVASKSESIARDFQLEQNYPNPFNPSTSIAFALAKAGSVKLEIYNALGQKVARLVNSKLAAGPHNIAWDARNVPSGIYFYKLEAGAFNQTRKMVLMK
ncbi:MAG: T9SS type A sorting domain-containing protein [bacterium]